MTPLQVMVDRSRCDNHGQCVFAAPEVFSFDDDEVLAYDAAPAAVHIDAVRAAAAQCPVGAITVSEVDRVRPYAAPRPEPHP